MARRGNGEAEAVYAGIRLVISSRVAKDSRVAGELGWFTENDCTA
jgi:hypothetical protein